MRGQPVVPGAQTENRESEGVQRMIADESRAEVRDLMWSRADTVVWLAYPRRVSTTRVVRRSFVRAWDQEPMFNGNTEDFRAWLDPEHPIQWSVRAYRSRQEDMRTRFRDPANAALHKVHLRTPRAAQRWLDLVAPAAENA